MTQTVERRPLARPTSLGRRSQPSVLLPGAIGAAWALGAGLVMVTLPVLMAWATDGRSGSGAGAALRTAGQIWLVAHGTGLALHLRGGAGALHLTPLGLTLVPLLLLHRAGRHSARTVSIGSGRRAVQLALAISLPYGLAAAVIAAAAATRSVTPNTVEALSGAFAVGLAGSLSGILRESRTIRSSALPDRVRRLGLAAAAGAALLIAGGAGVVALSLLIHAGRVATLASATGPGLVGGLALALLGLCLLPNAVIWGVAWVVGPGFAVGVGTSVSPWSTSLGAVPAFPLLGALPSDRPPAWAGVLALLVPLAAGVVGGWLVGRRLPTVSLVEAALEGLMVAPCLAAVVALLALVSGGPLGSGRLAAVGPSAWRVGLMVLAETVVPAALGAVAASWMRLKD